MESNCPGNIPYFINSALLFQVSLEITKHLFNDS